MARVMNSSPVSPARQAPVQPGCWLLEIVRGRDVGRAFPLEPGETIVGNSLNGQSGLDLREQEGTSPRRMAGRHASFICAGRDVSIRDLESPGGTFVNQQRLLSGQPRKLSAGDVIQLGGVQLKVKEGSPTTVPDRRVAAGSPPVTSVPRPPQGSPKGVPDTPGQPTGSASGGRLPTSFSMANGGQCRSWDDFLILSAQSWAQVREELVSGRLAEFLRWRIGRAELTPVSAPNLSPDERLDEWLARIPVTQSSAPELDVHPETLLVQAKMGGGVARLSLRITNVGFRLLRSSLRVEPADARWVKLLAGGDGKAFPTIDQTEIPVELELPETIDRVLRATIVIESNGGTRRVEVRIERPAETLPDAKPAAAPSVMEIPVLARQLGERLARMSLLARAAVFGGGAALVRLIFAARAALPLWGGASSVAEPRIAAVAVLTVGLGVLCGLILARQRGESRDLLTVGLAGGLLGLLSSAPAILGAPERGALSGFVVELGCGGLSLLGRGRCDHCAALKVPCFTPLGRWAGEPLMARYVGIVLVVLGLAALARGETQVPADQEVARAIAKGVEFLKEEQGDSGEWQYGEQPQHSLGMTALAGLALLENGIARDAREISKAREIVATRARESNQTYDLALAILFLARCQQTRTGGDDSLIQLLGRRLGHGDHAGSWDYSVPISEEEATSESRGSRRGGRGRAARTNRGFNGAGDNSNTQFALLGIWAAGRHGVRFGRIA